MALRRFINELRGVTVKEVPDKVKPMLSFSYLKESFAKGIDSYHAKYIETDSIMPLYHVCFGGMAFSYLVALPEERRHLEHAQKHGH
ncbi:uncharacterized protein LOC110696995 [Chenopodium quinoa]|uniref:Fiber protein Fb15 n=1 Tax=Chenopodium quinoa TaxID=63459 RepID=A0A803LSZ6_CHEQI|nr:uncharacterized protein LOC110696995 [Chenopodium quinoa]